MGGRPLAAAALVAVVLLSPLARGSAAALSLPPEIPPAERTRLQEVADAAAVSTHVDGQPFLGRPSIFEYLIDHPEFATHVTRALRKARYRIWRTPDGLALDDGWGTTGVFRVVHAARGLRVMYARGQYDNGPLPSINGEAVTMIDWHYVPAPGGRQLVVATVTGFVKLDSRVMTLAIKAASGIAQRKADLEARRLVKTFARVSRAVDEDPAGLLVRLRARPDVPQRELEEFSSLLSAR